MAGFTTVPDGVRAAGRTVADAVNALRPADCGAPVADLTAALPGGASATAATGYARSWSGTFASWCTQAGGHAANLARAAANYDATEGDNAGRLQPGIGPR